MALLLFPDRLSFLAPPGRPVSWSCFVVAEFLGGIGFYIVKAPNARTELPIPPDRDTVTPAQRLGGDCDSSGILIGNGCEFEK